MLSLLSREMCGAVLNAFEFCVCVVLCSAAIDCRLIMLTLFCRLRLLVAGDMKATDIVVDLLLVELDVVVRGSFPV